jgi:hypothetical protein
MMIQTGMIGWVEHESGKTDVRNVFKIVTGKLEAERLLKLTWHRLWTRPL